MREVPRDDKWGEENTPNTTAGSPSEAELVIISLLMRLYDIQMALLNEANEKRADAIYEAHEQGGHFNPEIFIPDRGAEDVEEE